MLFERLGASPDGLNLELPVVPVTPLSKPKSRGEWTGQAIRLIALIISRYTRKGLEEVGIGLGIDC